MSILTNHCFFLFFIWVILHNSFCAGAKNKRQKLQKQRFCIYVVLFLSFLNSTSTIAQSLIFSHLNIENGLSDRSVLAIAQDDRGFMWFCTKEGLNRFDSRTIKVYRATRTQKNELSFPYVMCILSDSHHSLWIGTGNGLNRYRPRTDDFEYIPFISSVGENWNAKNIFCIYEDHHGRVWFGTDNGLFVLENNQQLYFKHFEAGTNGLPDNTIRAILEDDSGTVWIGTTNGLSAMKKNGSAYAFTNFRHEDGHTNSLSGNNISDIVQDAQHNIWISSFDKGLNKLDAQHETFSSIGMDAGKNAINNHIRKMAVDKLGNLWLGTQNGLTELNTQTNGATTYQHNNVDNNSLSQNSIYSLFFDKENTLWCGTYFGGVNHIGKSIFTIHQNKPGATGTNSNVTSSMVEDKNGNLWVGTEGGGLNFINQKTNTIESFTSSVVDPKAIGSDLIKTIYKDKDGNIWIGTHGGGLNLLNADGRTFTRFLYKENDPAASSTEIYAMAEDANGLFWVATKDEGVKVFTRKGTQLIPFSNSNMPGILQHARIFYMLQDSKGNVWAAGDGLYLYNKNSQGFQVFRNNSENGKAIINMRINCLREDVLGNVWIGTHGDGLFRFDPSSNKIERFTDKNGLLNMNVLGILEDDSKNLWISTSNGLCNFDTKQHIFRTYTTSDGLPANEFNNNSFLKTKDGELFFGGLNGYVSFLPDDAATNKTIPNIFITGLKLFNQPVEINGKDNILSSDISYANNIHLNYDQNMLAIDFALLSFSRSEKNKFAYQIDGIDKNWNYTSIPTANITNLPPGSYMFSAKGANNDGIWSEPVNLKITVLPPFWRTWWAYLVYVLIFASIVLLVTRYFFLRALMKKDAELTQLKLNFFTNISHEIRTHLSLITGPVEKIILSKKEQDDNQLQLQTIKKNSESLLKLVNELMDFRKAETGNLKLQVTNYNIVPFVQTIYSLYQEKALSKNILTDFLPSAKRIDVYFDKEQMEKVFSNLLSNAYKFTPNGGRISIKIEETETSVKVQVCDNGKGISPENLHKLFDNYFQEDDKGKQNTGYGIGLALSKSIVELHSGSLTAQSGITDNEPENKTVFSVLLPKGKAHFIEEEIISINPTFPVADLNLSTNLISENNENQIIIPLTSTKKNTILLVEDNPEIRSFIKSDLYIQYEIVECENGKQGLETALQLLPDLIISDVMMPEMDGYMLCHHLKTDERTNHIPVILLTAKASVENHVSGLQMGADAYLTKPFSIQVLALQVQNLLSLVEVMQLKLKAQIVSPTKITDDDTNLGNKAKQNSDETKSFTTLIENEFIQKIVLLTEQYMDDPNFGVEMVAQKVAMSQSVLYKKVRAVSGMTVNDIIKSVRLRKAAELVAEKKYTVYEISDMVGYADAKYFSREFKKEFGVSPKDYS